VEAEETDEFVTNDKRRIDISCLKVFI